MRFFIRDFHLMALAFSVCSRQSPRSIVLYRISRLFSLGYSQRLLWHMFQLFALFMLGGMSRFLTVLGVTTTCITYQQGPRHLRPLPQFVDCRIFSLYRLVLLSVVLHVDLVIAVDLSTKQSVYHPHTRETFSLASEARSTSLEHVRAHVSTRLDRGQT